jgi:hypothetical protein
MERSVFVKPSVPHFYRYGGVHSDERASADDRCAWLETLLLQHELYVPLASDLNDLREARPKMARKSAEEITTFMREQISEIHPHLSEKERQAHWRKIDDVVRDPASTDYRNRRGRSSTTF